MSLFVSGLCCWLPNCVDAVNLASSLALTEGMLAAHLLPFTLFMALQIKMTFTHTLCYSASCTAHLATHIASSGQCRRASLHKTSCPSSSKNPRESLCCFWSFLSVLRSLSLAVNLIVLNPLFVALLCYFCHSFIPHTHRRFPSSPLMR